jgi:hypothetical protein
LVVAINVGIGWGMNGARVDGNCSWVAQFAVAMIQLNFVAAWRQARTHNSFDNVLKARERTILLLTDGGRLDLAKKVDDEIIKGASSSRCFSDNLLMIVLMAPAIWLVIGKGNVMRAIVFEVCLATADHMNNMSGFGELSSPPQSPPSSPLTPSPTDWSILCQLHSLQIQLFHESMEVAFTDLASATTQEEERRVSIIEDADGAQEGGGGVGRQPTNNELLESTEFFEEEVRSCHALP